MPRARGSKDYLSLAKGLVTESSPLAAPEGTTADELNMLLEVKGGVRVRRKGLVNQIDDISIADVDSIDGAFHWTRQNMIVVASRGTGGVTLHFHDDSSLLELTRYALATAPTNRVQFGELRGNLLVTSGNGPLVLTKQEGFNSIDVFDISLYIRDFKLVDDNVSVSTRPNLLSDEHKYNLLNAGWYSERKLESTGQLGDPIEEFSTLSTNFTADCVFVVNNVIQVKNYAANGMTGSFTVTGSVSNDGTYTVASTAILDASTIEVTTVETTIVNETSVSCTITTGGEYPSNADISLLGLKDDGGGNEVFSRDTLLNTSVGNTEAPRGHYVYNITDIERQQKTLTPSVDGTSSSTLTQLTTLTWV